MVRATISFICFIALLSVNLVSANAQTSSPNPQSKEDKEATKREEKERKSREKVAAEQAEKDRKAKEKEVKLQAKFEETRPINRTSSYDRFKDLTTFNMDKMLIFGNNNYTPVAYGIANIWLTGGYYIQGQTWKKPEQVILQFEVLEADWEYRDPNNRNLILLVDGERINLGVMGQEEFNVRYVGNLEKLFVSVPYEVFVKIATAKSVEAQLGRLEFPFDQRHLQGLRNLVGLTENEKVIASDENLKQSSLIVKVSAANVTNGWTNAGISVYRGQRLRISATGKISLGSENVSTPAGIETSQDRNRLIKNKPTGGLVAVIGNDNNDFYFIGDSLEFVAQRSGILFLGINEGNLEDNSGEFEVTIQRY